MDIKILTQPKLCDNKRYTLGGHIQQLLSSKKNKFTGATFFFGLTKDNAFEKIFEDIKAFILNGGNVKFYLSQSQKGNTKKIINSLLELGCEVYLFKNESKDFISDFQYKGVIFENSKKSVILLASGNFSLSGLFDGYNTVTIMEYDLSVEQQDFEVVKKNLFPKSIYKMFTLVTREIFEELFPSEILSIEEFTHKDVDIATPLVTSIDDINIDIEINDDVDFLETPLEIEKPQKEIKIVQQSPKKIIPEPLDTTTFEGTKYFMEDEALDVEDMLFVASSSKSTSHNKAPILEKTNIIEPDIDEEVSESKIIAKSTNLSKTSIFMLQLPKITKKGTCANEIKIPLYLRDLIPAFWGWPKEYSLNKELAEKFKICTFKIIDTIDAKNTIIDDQVKLFQREGENSFSILSEKLVALEVKEMDIMRFIKTESENGSYFTCEIVRTSANEYPIWEQFCTNYLKGSKRKYGTM